MPTPKPEKKPHHLLIIIGVGKPKPGQPVGFRSAKKKAKSDSTATKARAVGGK